MKPLRLVFLLPLLAVACSKAPEEPSSALTSSEGVLRYVPADTPYVFAALESPPKEVSDKLGAASMKVMRAYGKMVRGIINQPPAEGAAAALDDETRERVSAMIDELTGMVTPEGIPEAGIDRSSTVAIYGVGLLPVVRVTLSDGALFEATFATLEADAGKPMSVASIDGHSYRYAGND
ncbi:MAG TPA: hypothetical protein VE175_08760, partial [Woeseiaceae bacterium]|nr:hypothetical protein [Woeseiaceae bacterium]